MHISHIRIRNILGIAEYDFAPGRGFTEISGKNGQGKTTILEAVKAIAKGGHDATLLTAGAEDGEIVYVLDNGMEIAKTITETKTDISVRLPGSKKKEAAPAAIVGSLVDQLSNNPVELLRAKPKERVKVLLESMPIDVDTNRLTEIVGFDVVAKPGVHGLYVIDEVRSQVFSARTGTNRALDEKKKTIKQLRDVVPEGVGEVGGSEDVLEAQLGEIDVAKNAELARIETKLQGVRSESAARVDDIKAKAEQSIEDLRQQIASIQEQCAADVEAERAALQETEGRAGTQRQRTLDKHAADRAPIHAQLSAIRTNRDAAAKREQALETIETMEVEAQTLKEESEAQTAALEQIDAYKLELLATLPIPGIEVRGEQLYRDGVPLDRLNTQQQVDIAIEVAKLRAGKLGVVCVDGLELMDDEHYQAFQQKALESGLQFFVSRVSNSDFEVRTM